MNAQTDTYQRIVDSAKELFHANSYADVGVAAICEKAKVQKGSFYHYFKSKQELTLAVIDTYYSDFKDSIIDQAFDSALPPLKRLERFIELSIEMQTKIHELTSHVYGCPFGNLVSELSTKNEDIRCKLNSKLASLNKLFSAALQEALENGDVTDIDVNETARAMLAMFEGSMLIAKAQNDPQLLHQLLPAALQIRIKPTH